ncbi:MAG TPA: twin-arginine translocase subunit TatC [Kofleriaceae bacterium]|nr:twin-arginine translocase subunit TatC [Kofleriaceae bacterium]
MARSEEPATVDDEAELEQGRMPFFAHLVELRNRLRNAAIFFVIGVVVSWIWAEQIYAWLRVPLDHAWAHAARHNPTLGDTTQMAFTSIVEPFWVYMSVALWAGIFVASPFIFHQIWKFVAPGLYKRERRYAFGFALISALFFVGGALFCYYLVLGNLYSYLLSYADKHNHPVLTMSTYFDLTKDMMLAFGAVFELPILIYFLAMVGLVTPRGLWRFNRWFIVLAFIIGAILTPSPDVVSQILMATPMIVLYNLSILVSFLALRRKQRKSGMPAS